MLLSPRTGSSRSKWVPLSRHQSKIGTSSCPQAWRRCCRCAPRAARCGATRCGRVGIQHAAAIAIGLACALEHRDRAAVCIGKGHLRGSLRLQRRRRHRGKIAHDLPRTMFARDGQVGCTIGPRLLVRGDVADTVYIYIYGFSPPSLPPTTKPKRSQNTRGDQQECKIAVPTHFRASLTLAQSTGKRS